MSLQDAFSSVLSKTLDTIYLGNSSIAAGATQNFTAFKVADGASYQIGNASTFTRLIFSLSGIEETKTLKVTATVDGETVAQKNYTSADNGTLVQDLTFNNVAGKDVVVSMISTNAAAEIKVDTFRAPIQLGKVTPQVNG